MTEHGANTPLLGQNASLSSDEPGKGIDRVAGILSTTKTYIADIHAGDSTVSPEDRASRALEKFLDTLEALCPEQETAPERNRWTAAACQSVRSFLDALRDADRAAPGSIPAPVLARAGAEAIRWNLVNRNATDASLWAWLGDLFASVYGEEVQRLRGGGETVAREILRALGYHAAALDQQTLRTGFAIARIISVLLPDLLMTREKEEGALYGINIVQRGSPVRLAQLLPFTGWWFATADAADRLSDIHGDLFYGRHPVGLEKANSGDLRAAVVHLRRQWSSSPPLRRYQRYPLNARLRVVRGYEQAMSLLDDDAEEAVVSGAGTWHITDLSAGGVGAIAPRSIKIGVPAAGDLVAFCPEEGTRWHIGVVRRLRMSKSHVEIGIATLSSNPELARVDDGRAPRNLFTCDPVRRGEAIRLVAPVGTLGNDDPIFVVAKNAVHKLRPLAEALRGKSFDLRVYQVT